MVPRVRACRFSSVISRLVPANSGLSAASKPSSYRATADKVIAAVVKACWDSAKGLLADTPAKKTFSQHVNLLGVLADAVPAGRRALMTKVLDDRSLTQTTYAAPYPPWL